MAGNKMMPNLSWNQFKTVNDAWSNDFESMCWALFKKEFVKEGFVLQAEPCHPGTEAEPIPSRLNKENGEPLIIGFQSKFYENKVDYSDIKSSMIEVVEKYSGIIDRVYLFCNLSVSLRRSPTYRATFDLLKQNGIELIDVTNKEIFSMLLDHMDIANYFFFDRYRGHTIVEKPVACDEGDVNGAIHSSSVSIGPGSGYCFNILAYDDMDEQIEILKNQFVDYFQNNRAYTINLDTTNRATEMFRMNAEKNYDIYILDVAVRSVNDPQKNSLIAYENMYERLISERPNGPQFFKTFVVSRLPQETVIAWLGDAGREYDYEYISKMENSAADVARRVKSELNSIVSKL